ncbi:Proline iminopeptidase [uncultured Woeseiaceae bacterium]|uniref:Proline iminopeptidase n=1 Tax=uncultured Woeseiaceae bacterium TaxID=1983305 RepID=A0A7D9H4R0_9GAMM|nr:Proline iminopeptidase [uncultured Woeseiaceae bacterium]
MESVSPRLAPGKTTGVIRMKRSWLAALLLTLCSVGICRDSPQPGQGFIDVPGGPVWYSVAGTGPGIPLLVLHGGPGGRICGYSLLDALGSERPIVRYDQLGSGRSGRPDDPSLWTVDRFVEELHVVRQQLGLGQMHLLGHSWGGALAAAYVLEKGTDGIASVILSSPLLSTPLWIEDANYLRSLLPADVQQTLTEHEAAGTINSDEYQAASYVFYERHVYGGQRMEAPTECDGAPSGKFVYEYMWGPTEFNATGNLLDFDVTDRLHEIEVPVLFIAGQFDEARPERVAEFQKLISGSKLTIILDAAHSTLSKKPNEYRNVVETFLDSVEGNKK